MNFKRAAVVAIAATYLALSGAAAFAQAGGADVPSDAKKAGTQENGSSSTGMSKSEANGGSMKKSDGMEKSGSMEKKSDGKM